MPWTPLGEITHSESVEFRRQKHSCGLFLEETGTSDAVVDPVSVGLQGRLASLVHFRPCLLCDLTEAQLSHVPV